MSKANIIKQIDLVLLLALAVGLFLRLHFLFMTDWGIEADEAIVGLMAKHIIEGKPWPVFYYGQYYMGSPEAIVTAFVFWLFGQSNVNLKLVPLIVSLVQILLVYSLAKRFLGRTGARIAAWLTAVGPSVLIVWSTKPRGGFIELVAIGTYCLLLAVDLLESKRIHYKKLGLLGLLLGFGWWINNQILFYIAAIGISFVVSFIKRYGFWLSAKQCLWTLVCFFIGGAPFWHVNLFTKPMFKSWGVLGNAAGGQDILEHISGYFFNAIPILFGARRMWGTQDLFEYSSEIVWLLYAISLTVFFLRWLRLLKGKAHGRVGASSYGMLLVFSFLVPTIFCLSGFGGLSKEPRYLLPMFSVLYVIIAAMFVWIWDAGKWGRFLSILVFGSMLGLNISSTYLGGFTAPGEPEIFEGERVSHDHASLYSWLAKNKYNHIITNYWIGYRVAFETNERVTFSRFYKPKTLRIPEYERISPEE